MPLKSFFLTPICFILVAVFPFTVAASDKIDKAVNTDLAAVSSVQTTKTSTKPPAKKLAKKAFQYTRIFYYVEGKQARSSFFAHPSSIDVFAPQSYSIDSNGVLSGGVDQKLLNFASAHKIKVMPLVTNGNFNQDSGQSFLDDTAKQDAAIVALISEAKHKNYWGWQIDFEQMDLSYKDKFSGFVNRFGQAMKANDLISSVAVVAQVSRNAQDYIDPEDQVASSTSATSSAMSTTSTTPTKNQKDLWKDVIGVYDYAPLASSTDFLSIMSYDDPLSKGPVAQYDWLKKVIAYSLTQMPKEKLSLGIGLYYWRWDDESQKLVGIGGVKNFNKILYKHKVTRAYSAQQQSPYLKYRSAGKTFTVWYENARSMAKKIELITKNELYGFSAWALGLEMPDIHSVVKK